MSDEGKYDFRAITTPTGPCPIITASGLRTLFTRILRQHWENRQHVSFLRDELECLVYGENLSVHPMEMILDADNPKTNAIFVGIGPVTVRPMGHQQGASVNSDRSRVLRTAQADTQLIAAHISDSADLALNMAESSFTFLYAATEQLTQSLHVLEMLRPAAIGQLQPHNREQRPKGYRVDCVFDITFPITIATTIESHRLKRIGLRVEPLA